VLERGYAVEYPLHTIDTKADDEEIEIVEDVSISTM
jgi:hypothetical protein